MFNKDKYYILLNKGHWLHRTPLKCCINPVLRFFQPWTNRKLVIASKTEFDKEGIPHFKGYSFKRVFHI